MISQITNIVYQNAWPSQNGGPDGNMHTSMVYFADGKSGTANHKTLTPPYKVGDMQNYEIVGDFRGTPKLKITRPQLQGQQQPQQPQYTPPAPQPQAQYQQPPQNAPQSTQTPIHGATVGMALNQACEFSRVASKGFDKQFIYETASALLRLSQKLEKGQLAPLSAPPMTNMHQPPQPPQRPRPGPEGQAFDYSNQQPPSASADGDEIPF